MNEYDDILNRIVEEFYDTGRLKLLEEIEFDVENEDFDVDYEVLKGFWLKYKQLPRYNRIRNDNRNIRVKYLYKDYPKDIALGTWIQYVPGKKFNDLYIKLLDDFNLYEMNELEKRGGKNYVTSDSNGNDVLLRSGGEVIAFNTLKYYGLDQDIEIDSRKFYNDCGEIYKEVDFLIPKYKTVIEIAGGESEKYFEKLDLSKECIEKFGWRYEYIKTKGKTAKYIHDRIVDILGINNSNYNHDEIINYKSLDKNKVKENLTKNLIDSEVKPYNETTRKKLEKGIEIIYGVDMSISELKNLHREVIKDFLNGDMGEKEKEFYLIPYLELISDKHKCDKCGKYKRETGAKLCDTCSRSGRRKERPPCEELLKPNINKSQIAREYGVSDVAVGKWVKECRGTLPNQNKVTDSEIDGIIENFFDTGKFVI